MVKKFGLNEFGQQFSDDDVCLEEIKKLRFPGGIFCKSCKKITKHYRLEKRKIYTCKYCRTQVAPLRGTIFEKSTTSLRLWFYCIFLMTYTRADISVKKLQKELGVTYKTAWRMYKNVRKLMEQNNGDLLAPLPEVSMLHRWTFFNKLEIKVVEKEENV